MNKDETPAMHALLTDFAVLRRMMVDSQLRPSEVIEPRLVAAMGKVAREHFVPAARRDAAYGDRSIPLGNGRALNPPLTTARLIDAVRVQPGDRVLLIGAATGYTAAVLNAMGARVVAVECDAALAEMARAALADRAQGALADAPGVTLIEAPLEAPPPGSAAFDVLLIDGAVATLPLTLTTRLVDGARIACGWTANGMTRLARGVHVAASAVPPGLVSFADYECVPLPGFAPPPRFEF